jgi:DNA recombination protein RmuC
MNLVWLFGIGLVVGLAVALGVWFVLRDRLRSSFEVRIADAEGHAAKAEGSSGELRQQLQQRHSDISALRTKLEEVQKARTIAETAFQAERDKLAEEKKLLQESRDRLGDAFKALADEALKSNNQAFLDLATQALQTVRAESIGDLELRREAIKALVDPLAESLGKYEGQVQALERSRREAYGDLKGLLDTVRTTQENLQRETSELVTALRRPSVRSRWGELTLRRVAELTGMVEHCDFYEQPNITGEDARFRPDMAVRMPGELYKRLTPWNRHGRIA